MSSSEIATSVAEGSLDSFSGSGEGADGIGALGRAGGALHLSLSLSPSHTLPFLPGLYGRSEDVAVGTCASRSSQLRDICIGMDLHPLPLLTSVKLDSAEGDTERNSALWRNLTAVIYSWRGA